VLLAATREVSPVIGRCELTHLGRTTIDFNLARAQHAGYERAVEEAGCTIVRVEPAPALPDSVFVEDIAVVLDEIGIVTRPGAESRRAEIDGVERLLEQYRPLAHIAAPATVDGGDVLVVGRAVFVGGSARTNVRGVEQMRTILAPHGYTVTAVPVSGCLHLKSAVTAISNDRLLVNRRWIDIDAFSSFDLVDIDQGEPFAANVLLIGSALVYPTGFPRTADILDRLGFSLRMVDVGELAKAEGAVTCCSVIFHAPHLGLR